MSIFHQIIDFFRSHHSKNTNKTTRNKSTDVTIRKKEDSVKISSPPTTSSISPKTPSNYSQLPEVEFEQSRHLLELDFFHIDDDRRHSSLITTFPQFEHLLEPPQEQQEEEEEEDQKKTSTINRNLTRTLRHRISMYRPHTKTVKRAISTPQLYSHHQ